MVEPPSHISVRLCFLPAAIALCRMYQRGYMCHRICVLPLHVAVRAAVFKYDTVHGVYGGTVEHDDSSLIVDGKKIKVSWLVYLLGR